MANGRQIRILGFHVALILTLLLSWAAPGNAATWTLLTNLPPNFPGTMILLTDGTVMVQNTSRPAYQGWMKLTPSSTGSYVNGTWSSLAPMSTGRLYFASEVLASGKVWVLGGEYTGIPITANWAATGELYDPVTNTWSPIASYPPESGCPFVGGVQLLACFGDDPSMLLPGGLILAGDLIHGTPHIYNIATDSWSLAGSKVYADQSDEEGWGKLPDGSVLTYDLFQSVNFTGQYAEKYNPATNTWSSISPSDGTASGFIPQLSGAAVGFELGPLLRLQDGRIFILGATGHTALYTPSTNTWAAGPDIMGTLNGIPALFGADDAPGAVLPNGHVLFAADAGPLRGTFSIPAQIFDFNPTTNTISPVSPAIPDSSLATKPSFVNRMLVLPTGQVLFNDDSRQLYVYTPDGLPNPGLRPSINSVVYNGAGVFTLAGKQLNGQSAGSGYGDDVESDENFPIIRLRNAAGQVFYARTTNWSSTGVATGLAPESVNFTLPSGMAPGNYSLVDVGAGISSFPVFINITAAEAAGL